MGRACGHIRNLASFALMFLLAAQTIGLAAAAGSPTAATAITPPANTASGTTPVARNQPGEVTKAVFTTGIKDHEPVDNVGVLSNDHTHIYFFTDLRHMTGETVTHRWIYHNKVMAQVAFKVGGPRWRVFSRKTLNPAWLGEWQVSVVDASGVTLGVSTFEYVAAPQTKSSAAPAPN